MSWTEHLLLVTLHLFCMVENILFTYPVVSVVFSISDFETQLRSLKVDSAMGPDNPHPMLLRECSQTLANPFYLLFKSSVTSEVVPKLWKHSIVTPIFKKGSKRDSLNYRLISLTPIPCKTLGTIITKSLYSFLDKHLIFDDAQFGFRVGWSVSHQLLLTYHKVTVDNFIWLCEGLWLCTSRKPYCQTNWYWHLWYFIKLDH